MTEVQEAQKAERLNIVEYTRRDFERFLTDDRFGTEPRLPTTKLRVISQLANSRADDDDIVLITAHSKGRLIAYLGILPDRLEIESQGSMKFGWLTTWWVDKESTQRLAATRLLFVAMKRYSNRIAISSFSEDAKRVYDATMQFQPLAVFDRSYFVIGLPPSLGAAARISWWAAGVKNRLLAGRSLQNRGLEVQTVDRFTDDLKVYIDTQAIGDPLARDASYWQWVLKFPWVSSGKEQEITAKNYAFSVFAEDFTQIPIALSRRGTIIAFIVMTRRDNRLTLKYAYYDPGDVADVAVAVRSVIAEVNPWLFISADTVLNPALRHSIPFYIAVRRQDSLAYASKAFPLSVGPRPQFGIGDSIFT